MEQQSFDFPFLYLWDQSVNTAADMVLILIVMNFLSSLIIDAESVILYVPQLE